MVDLPGFSLFVSTPRPDHGAVDSIHAAVNQNNKSLERRAFFVKEYTDVNRIL